MGFSNFTGASRGHRHPDPGPDGDHSASKLSVSIPAKTFSTSIEKLDGELTSADWFDAAKFRPFTSPRPSDRHRPGTPPSPAI